jgi:hypothetical protein
MKSSYQKDTCNLMAFAALFTIAKNMEPKQMCPADVQTKENVVDLHGGIYSVTKRMKSCHLQQHE